MRGRRNCTAQLNTAEESARKLYYFECDLPAGHPDEHAYESTGLTVRWSDDAASSEPDRDAS